MCIRDRRSAWDTREHGLLPIRGYGESGRVRDSVRRAADEFLQRLPAEDRKTVTVTEVPARRGPAVVDRDVTAGGAW
mgnify:CR=1 FL=1